MWVLRCDVRNPNHEVLGPSNTRGGKGISPSGVLDG